MIKAVFFDIDGTLMGFGKKEFSPSTKLAIKKLQAAGIKVCIASGRPPVQLPLLGDDFQATTFDGYVLMNGQCCMNEKKEIFYDLPIDQESLKTLVPWIKEHADYPCTFMELDYSYDIMFNQQMYTYLKSIGQEKRMLPVDDPIRALHHKTYQICPHIPSDQDAEFVRHAKGIQSARWTESFADMIPIYGGKNVGIGKMMEYFALKDAEYACFGDGGNDITMLESAPYGIAMGNANEEVKKHASYVTDRQEHDGLYKACIHFGWIKE